MAKKTMTAPTIGATPTEEENQGAYKADEKTYRVTPDFAMAVLNIIQLAMMSAQFGDKYAINAAEEIGSMVLIANPNDPTGTSMTIHPAWQERFQADAEAFSETISQLAKNIMAAEEKIPETASTPEEERS